MIRHVRSNWQDAVLVYGKCSKKIDGSFGNNGKKRLTKLLKKALGGGKGRKASAGIFETRCLGVCPKHAVTVVDTRVPNSWLVIKAGTSIEDVVAELMPLPDQVE